MLRPVHWLQGGESAAQGVFFLVVSIVGKVVCFGEAGQRPKRKLWLQVRAVVFD